MESHALEAGSSRLPNYLWVIGKVLNTLDPDEFWALYPVLKDVHAALGLPNSAASKVEALPADAAFEIFAAIRANSPGQPDLLGKILLNAARLDLQDCETGPDYRSLLDGSEGDKALCDAIGDRMGLPFDIANYLCHLSNRHKYLYVATPKVACTTLKHCLQQFEMNGKLSFRHYGEEHFPSLSPLLSPLNNPQVYFDALDSEDWFRFTFVRDPFHRALSCYLDKIVASSFERTRLLPVLHLDPAAGIPSFGEFLKAIAQTPVEEHDLHWAPQYWLTQPDKVRYHFIGRLERFDEDFAHLSERLGLTAEASAVRHSTQAGDKLASYYGEEEIALVQAIYARDFTTFGYDSARLTSR